MPIVENPLRYLIIALILLIVMLIFFKVMEFVFANSNKKSKNNKEDKKQDVVKSDKASSEEISKTEDKKLEGNSTTSENKLPSNGYNYLHDRFVENPTSEDCVTSDNNSSMFLSVEEYDKIHNEKIKIKVKENGDIGSKIDEIIKGDNSEKERLLDEFNNLSKEMKLLLIENILKNN